MANAKLHDSPFSQRLAVELAARY